MQFYVTDYHVHQCQSVKAWLPLRTWNNPVETFLYYRYIIEQDFDTRYTTYSIEDVCDDSQSFRED